MTKSLKQKLTLPLIGVLVLIIIILTGFFYFDKLLSRSVRIEDVHIDTKAALKLNILKQISKKNGIKEWELEAASATLFKNEDKAILIDVSIIFFTKTNKEVRLKSQKGVLNTKSHDMVFSGNVIVNHENSELKTDKLHYNKKKHIIYSDNHVKLTKDDSVIDADSMETNLNDNHTVLKGHVKGIFRDKFNIL
ncbi:MAG: LPS export ABC transporter periplasmic protein LptC [Desulfobacula sp.]|nr:LPS export ABC transporter periplasmic protein LptC [Desulfobacula sp.]